MTVAFFSDDQLDAARVHCLEMVWQHPNGSDASTAYGLAALRFSAEARDREYEYELMDRAAIMAREFSR